MSTNAGEKAGQEIWDAIVIGGGPAGSIGALALAQRGRRVIVLEKATFPRFHIGESFLPATFVLLQELGLEPALRKLPHVPKFGAEFVMGYGGHVLRIEFADGFCRGAETFNIERSIFDEMLLHEAKRAGVEVRQASVKQILTLKDGDVRIQTEAGELRGRYLLDASGQGTVVGRHLGTRRTEEAPHLKKVAYFNQFENVYRHPGREGGHPLIAMMEEGWFWMIPLTDTKTSVGMVLDVEAGRRITRDAGVPPERMLAWGIEHCPAVKERMRGATCTGAATHGDGGNNQVLADFSYRCRPYAGEGHFLVGDAAAFMDPIFSTGVSVAVNGATAAARLIDDILGGRTTPARARALYISQLEQSTGTLFRIIRQYYDHSFRELFLSGRGPFEIHRAVIGVLAGNVFPRPPWKLRWRLKLFDWFIELNRKKRIAVRRRRFSLLKELGAPQGQTVGAGQS